MTPLVSLMVALTAARLAVAAILPLAPDETYYWVWSHALAAGYLDHPPMVAFWIRIGTLLAGQSALGVRLLGPLSAALASWFLFDAAQCLFPGRRAGSAAVLLLNGSLLLGVGSVIMTPDAPLIFFWTATLWAMVRLIDSDSGVWWLAAGLFGGLALDSKYTALFLWVGVGLWVLLVPAARPWLRRWEPWAAVVLGTALFAPVLIWNAAHGWVGFARQGGRVGDWQPMRAVGFLAELFGGQIGLATPWIFILCMTGLVVAARRTWTRREPRWSLLAALSVPPGTGVRPACPRRPGAGQLAGHHLSSRGARGGRAGQAGPEHCLDRRLGTGLRCHRGGLRPGYDRPHPAAAQARSDRHAIGRVG